MHIEVDEGDYAYEMVYACFAYITLYATNLVFMHTVNVESTGLEWDTLIQRKVLLVN